MLKLFNFICLRSVIRKKGAAETENYYGVTKNLHDSSEWSPKIAIRKMKEKYLVPIQLLDFFYS